MANKQTAVQTKEQSTVYTIRIKNENVKVFLTEEGKKRLEEMNHVKGN